MSGPLLALDLGTTGVRALVVAPDGRVRARAYRRLSTRHPAPGRVEQDPEELWRSALEVMREALAASGVAASELAGLGLATQRATALAWDAGSGLPLAPALGWQDQRTAERVASLRARGLPFTTLPSATKFEWWLEHEPAVREAAASGRLRLGTPDAWLGYRLSGGAVHVTDPGQASCSGLFDLSRSSWSGPLLELFSLDSLDEAALPRVVATSQVVAESDPAWLGAAVPLAARAGDQQAATFAHGAHTAGEAKLTLGTAAMLDLTCGEGSGSLPGHPSPGCFPMAFWTLEGRPPVYGVEGSVLTAGAAVEWLVGIGLLSEPAALDRVAGSVAGREGVSFVPALQGLGAPFADGGARGLVGGITRGTTSAHIVRAAVEGIAQRCADVVEALGTTDRPLPVGGGLAQSDLLLQTLSDLLGVPLLRAAEPEMTALGAAWLAGLAAGVYTDPEQCRDLAAPPRRFEPQTGSGRDTAWRRLERARWRRVVQRARTAEAR